MACKIVGKADSTSFRRALARWEAAEARRLAVARMARGRLSHRPLEEAMRQLKAAGKGK